MLALAEINQTKPWKTFCGLSRAKDVVRFPDNDGKRPGNEPTKITIKVIQYFTSKIL